MVIDAGRGVVIHLFFDWEKKEMSFQVGCVLSVSIFVILPPLIQSQDICYLPAYLLKTSPPFLSLLSPWDYYYSELIKSGGRSLRWTVSACVQPFCLNGAGARVSDAYSLGWPFSCLGDGLSCLLYSASSLPLLCVPEIDDDGGGQQYEDGAVAVTKASILKIDGKATKSKESQQLSTWAPYTCTTTAAIHLCSVFDQARTTHTLHDLSSTTFQLCGGDDGNFFLLLLLCSIDPVGGWCRLGEVGNRARYIL